MAFLELHEVVKSFGRNTVVRGLSLNVEKGEFVSLLGGSGCGKTTTLRMIAGFETPSEGRILVGGADVSRVPPNRRNLGMVFQNYALFPNMSVRRNIGFGIRIAGRRGEAVEKRVDEMLELIHMEEFAQRYPHQLSGGQQQRVALARAIAIQPQALLLDEPLSALDAKIRVKLRDDIRAIQQKLGITTIYVTHDQEEALSISDRVAVMREGLIEQIGAPSEIYNRPATPYVAAFIGTQNILSAKVIDPAAGLVSIEGQSLGAGAPLDARAGDELRMRVRPEALSLDTAGPNRLGGRVANRKLLGSIVRLIVRVGDSEVFVDGFNDPLLELPAVGEAVTLSFSPDSCTFAKPGVEPVAAVALEDETETP